MDSSVKIHVTNILKIYGKSSRGKFKSLCYYFYAVYGSRVRVKSANSTAVVSSCLGASLGFHATMNLADADFTL